MSNRTMPLRSVDAVDYIANEEIHQSTQMNSIGQFQKMSPTQIKMPNNSNVVSENSLEEKSEVEVFFTKDQNLLDQYYKLRHFSYREENGWKDYDGSESKFDRQARILVATRNGKVIGGTRIMFSDECDYLSNEIPGTDFNYKTIVKKYDNRENIVFSEISSVVVVKGERDRSISMKLFEANLSASKQHGCHYICGVGVAVVCRDYRRIFKELGYYLEILINRPWQEKNTYNLVKMFPMHVKIS